jgi:hypothetical protein
MRGHSWKTAGLGPRVGWAAFKDCGCGCGACRGPLVGSFDTLLPWSWFWISVAGPVDIGVGTCACDDDVATGFLVFAVKRPKWPSVAKWTRGVPLG